MHPPVWNRTLPHARAWRRIATGPDSILVGRPRLLKLILAGLAVVVLLGASACGGATAGDASEDGAQNAKQQDAQENDRTPKMTAGTTGPKTIETSMRAMTTERVMAVEVKTRTTIESAARTLGMTATMRTTTEATTDRAPTTETMVVETMTLGTMTRAMTEATAKMDAMTTGTIATTIRTTAMTTTETEDFASSGVINF